MAPATDVVENETQLDAKRLAIEDGDQPSKFQRGTNAKLAQPKTLSVGTKVQDYLHENQRGDEVQEALQEELHMKMPNYVVVKNKRDNIQEQMQQGVATASSTGMMIGGISSTIVPLMSVTGGASLDAADILCIIRRDLHDFLDP